MMFYNLGLLNGTTISVMHGAFAVGEVPPDQEHAGKAIIFTGGTGHIAAVSRPELLDEVFRLHGQVASQRQAARESQQIAQRLGLGGRVLLPTGKG